MHSFSVEYASKGFMGLTNKICPLCASRFYIADILLRHCKALEMISIIFNINHLKYFLLAASIALLSFVRSLIELLSSQLNSLTPVVLIP